MTIVVGYIEQTYSLRESVTLDQPYSMDTIEAVSAIEQIYGLRTLAMISQPYSDAPVVMASLRQYYSATRDIRTALEQPYRCYYRIMAALDQPYAYPELLRATLDQRYSIAAERLLASIDQLYSIRDVELARAILRQPWALLGDGRAMSYQVAVTVGGNEIDIIHADIEGGIDQFCLSCELILADAGDYNQCRIMDEIIITIDGDEFYFFVEAKSRNRRHGSTDYIITGLSPSAKLDGPYAEPVTDELAGLASQIASAMAGPVQLSWQTIDWYIPQNTLLPGDATPMEVIRQLAAACGAVVQSDPDGSIYVVPEYLVSVPNWDAATPDYTLSDALDFFSTSEDFDHRPGYNAYLVGDQMESAETVRIEPEDDAPATKLARVYQTPWQDDFDLTHTGGDWVVIEDIGVSEREVTEQAEFVAGEASVSYPIYGIVSMEWLRVPLGSVTIAEDGRLEAQVEGESLLAITYLTRCHEYIVTDRETEPLQLVAKEAA